MDSENLLCLLDREDFALVAAGFEPNGEEGTLWRKDGVLFGREAALQSASLKALHDLQSKGKVLAGGHPVGQRYIVMFMEADSEEEEVRELLGGLPLSELGSTSITELKSFEESRGLAKRARRGLLS